jgi:uncharacterized protein YigA (DUF484 family)
MIYEEDIARVRREVESGNTIALLERKLREANGRIKELEEGIKELLDKCTTATNG